LISFDTDGNFGPVHSHPCHLGDNPRHRPRGNRVRTEMREGGGDLPPWARFPRSCGRPTGRHVPAEPTSFLAGRCGQTGPNIFSFLDGAEDMGPVDGATDTGRAGVGAPVLLRIRTRFNSPPVFPPFSMARCESRRGNDQTHQHPIRFPENPG
jgi:hypothetical protein